MIPQLKAKRAKALDDAKAIVAVAEKAGRELNTEEAAKVKGLTEEAVALRDQISNLEALNAESANLAIPAPRLTSPDVGDEPAAPALRVAAVPKRFGRVKNFQNANDAHRFGMWFLGAVRGVGSARKFCMQQGIPMAVQSEGVNDAGGFLVPEEFSNTVIDLREKYGIFRQYAKIVPMMSETLVMPRRTGGLTAYFVGENGAGTESTKAWDDISLVAKKLMVLTRSSNELNEDAAINLGDDLIGEIAYAFANKEDLCGFLGDGTSAYGGITGVTGKIQNLSATRANIAGYQVGTGNAYSELALVDFEGVVARLPQYADTPNARWFMHRSFFYNVAVRLELAAGGVTASEIRAGTREQLFLGYPVVFSQVMPAVEGNDQVCAIFGDLSLAAMIGDRRAVSIAQSTEASVGGQSMWERDQIGIRGTQRFDLNVHDVGNASATASLQRPGPVVVLATAAS